MSKTIPEPAKQWLDAQAFVTLATIEPDAA